MALAKMCKARTAVHRSVADELVGKLQNLGCCEFAEGASEVRDCASASEIQSKLRETEELLGDVRFALRVLEPLEVNKEGTFAKMMADSPAISLDDLACGVDKGKFLNFVALLREKEKKMTEYRAEISRFKGLLSSALQLEALSYPLEFFTRGTDVMEGSIFSVPKPSMSEMRLSFEKELGGFFDTELLPSGEKDSNAMIAVLYTKAVRDDVYRITSDFAAVRVDVPKDFVLTAAEEKNAVLSCIKHAEEEEAALGAELVSMADDGLALSRKCGDYWTILRDRFASMLLGSPTDHVFIWSFWLPEECLESVKKVLSKYDSMVDFAVIEPDTDELPPTLLKNPSWSSCMEPLTVMYGTPTYGGVDPTTLMAPFFFLFLGMCFGDAGYALIISGILGYFLVRHNLAPTLRKFFVMVTVGMVCAIIFGAITGSWFGDSVDAFPFLHSLKGIKNSVVCLDPMNDPMTLLIISLGLGFFQIMVGLITAFKSNWCSGSKFAALADQGGWMVFLVGLLLVGLSSGGVLSAAFVLPSKLTAIAGALILVATQGREKTGIAGKLFSGVLSLYNVTGYLGDVLSYSRILALGLGSAAVGMVINLLATLVVGVPYVGVLLAALIFVFGHTFSIAVNLLGAFIHSLRLQYVEFFGKFYDASGRDFMPLRNAVQHSKLAEDSTSA